MCIEGEEAQIEEAVGEIGGGEEAQGWEGREESSEIVGEGWKSCVESWQSWEGREGSQEERITHRAIGERKEEASRHNWPEHEWRIEKR